MSKVYVASSWRNSSYEMVIGHLRGAGHKIWDWRNPPTGGNGFRWQQCGAENYQHGDRYDVPTIRELLQAPLAQQGFASDLAGMNWCDVGVLLYDCGKSAHLEAGWIAGRGKKVHILAETAIEPDLMVLALNGGMFETLEALIRELAR